LSALDDLQAVMFKWLYRDTVIKPTLHRRTPECYRLQLIEDFGIVDDAGNHFPTSNLDDSVRWVDEQLQEWPDCKRMAWDMWDFKHCKDAEKFITLFHLSCPVK
jgi:hypothetical protein